MKPASTRTYSRLTKEASLLLGKLIRLGRQARKMTASDLADRAGITRNTLLKIESGDLTCEVGLVFEVATLAGVNLFNADSSSLTMQIASADSRIALLPKYVRKPETALEDDF